MNAITRSALKNKLDNGIVLLDVLAPEEYEDYHLPSALNVPLGDDFVQRVAWAFPDRERELVVYCRNGGSDASTRAVEELRSAGYACVLRYAAGKEDWLEAGLRVVR
jgi:rhodanese-related sulfurtransferase